MAKIKSIVKPNCITDDIRRKSVSFVRTHQPIVPQGSLSWQYQAEALVANNDAEKHQQRDPGQEAVAANPVGSDRDQSDRTDR